MTVDPGEADDIEAFWLRLLTSGEVIKERRFRNLFARLPHDPRCKLCNAQYTGAGAPLRRVLGRKPSNLTPNICEW